MPRWFPCVFAVVALSSCAVPSATPAGSGAPDGAKAPGATSGAAAGVSAASPVPAPKRTPVVAEVPEGAADATVRQVLSLEQGGPFVLSPDGQWAAITHTGWEREPTAASVAVVRLSDLEVRLLSTFPAIVTNSGYCVELRPQFTPGGTSLLVASLAAEEDGTALAYGDADVLLHRLPLDGEPKVIGTRPRNDFNDYWCEFPTWSPDGQRLAHVIGARSAPTPVPTDPLATAYPPPPGPRDYGDLVIADRDGSRQRVYATMTGLRFDGWARDGVHFRFEGDRRWWIGAEGEAPVEVPAPYLVVGGGAAWFVADRRSYTDEGHPVGKLVLLGPGGTRAELPPGSVGFDVAR